ncbi:MAG: HprK-related kinase A [Rubrivivax sp.]
MLDVGIARIRVRTRSLGFSRQLQRVYRHFPLAHDLGWADIHVDLAAPSGLRRWIRPQVVFRCDGSQPFDPFPADSPLPLFEWGANWLIGQRCNDYLLFHAGVVERDGHALILPALPGSGKSTLSAALSLRGWRLLSDEFGALDPETGLLHAVLKPVALKNQSIDVIRRWAPDAPIGPLFPKTRKGTVAHLSASPDAVARRHEPARPGAVVLPRWVAGSPTQWRRLPPEEVFRALAFNSFNYAVLGEEGFSAAVRIARQCPAWQLVYSDLADAAALLEREWPSACAAADAVAELEPRTDARDAVAARA